MRASRDALRFVRALLGTGEAVAHAGVFRAGTALLGAPDAAGLLAQGVISGDERRCRPGPQTRAWLRRQLSMSDEPYAGQHREEVRRPDGVRVNLNESPLARLASVSSGEGRPFLEPHQVEAGERVRTLCDRARLQPRVTMSYSPAHVAGSAGATGPAAISDSAVDARRRLAEIPRILPADCAGVVIDVCGLLKGLQVVETERGWPRRSAKLVLRIGLDQLARHYGLEPVATGAETRRVHRWLDAGARPDLVG